MCLMGERAVITSQQSLKKYFGEIFSAWFAEIMKALPKPPVQLQPPPQQQGGYGKQGSNTGRQMKLQSRHRSPMMFQVELVREKNLAKHTLIIIRSERTASVQRAARRPGLS